jgi:hypothetical protein
MLNPQSFFPEEPYCASKPTYQLYLFGFQPQKTFQEGGLLFGFKPLFEGKDYASPRAHALFQVLNIPSDHPEYVLGQLPDGRWGVIGRIEEGHRFILESLP